MSHIRRREFITLLGGAGPRGRSRRGSQPSDKIWRIGFIDKRFLLDLAEDWQQHGWEVFKRVGSAYRFVACRRR